MKKGQVAVNATIVIETLHHLIKRLGPPKGNKKANVFMNYGFPCYILDETTLHITRELLCEFTHLGIGGRDASILATMNMENISKIMTHDSSFKRIPKIHVIDPIPTSRNQ